jgi:hypothetical protein
MKIWTWIRTNCLLLLTAMVLGTWALILPMRPLAQNNCPNPVQGNNAVYNPSCNPAVKGSPAFIDASTFAGNVQGSPNLCSVLNLVLNPLSNIIPPGRCSHRRSGHPQCQPDYEHDLPFKPAKSLVWNQRHNTALDGSAACRSHLYYRNLDSARRD